MEMIKTSHGNIYSPDIFPTIGWPAGRGEYDRLFQNLSYFCQKIDHKHFLFNFSSFAFGFTIPNKNFHSQFDDMTGKDLRDILKEYTAIDPQTSDELIVLLDIGGNRIFNKIVYDDKNLTSVDSYQIYIDAYRAFITSSNSDIFVNFDIGPSYSTRDENSKKGVRMWNSIDKSAKERLNKDLLDLSVDMKNDNLMMVPVNGLDSNNFANILDYLYENYYDSIDIIGIAGIANKSVNHLTKVLKIFHDFKERNDWEVKSHGLGLGGWQKIPMLIKYEIDTCDVATPWRRACTDSPSQPYIPLFDANYEIMNLEYPFEYKSLYDPIFDSIHCDCPFCSDIDLSEVKKICFNADKRNNGNSQHDDDYYQMRVRIFFHNMFQHKALLKKMQEYKEDYDSNFISEFCKDIPSGKMKNKFNKF